MRPLILALTLAGCCFDASKDPAPVAPPPKPTLDARAEAAVSLAVKNGWLTAVNYEQDFATGSATVSTTWGSLSFETRQAVAASVAAAGMRRKDKATFTVNLVDANGRGVGIYSTVLGKLTQ